MPDGCWEVANRRAEQVCIRSEDADDDMECCSAEKVLLVFAVECSTGKTEAWATAQVEPSRQVFDPWPGVVYIAVCSVGSGDEGQLTVYLVANVQGKFQEVT